ncbi:MAG: adenylate/guanylate cyclase domain-containing protein [Chloroflexi bacterium]|nr:MAG: adenylate/guanylate cyclase domain-containing protein [Chloroflexota bacterium]
MSESPTATRTTVGASERRPLTVLFADIAGSTAIAERMDPEDWTAIVSQAFARMNATVTRYDGTIARLMGDGVLAFFGAPVAHEDDPVRAVRCGLDMARAVDELSAELSAKEPIDLKVRVGINTGPVVVGVVGTESASEYTAMGDAAGPRAAGHRPRERRHPSLHRGARRVRRRRPARPQGKDQRSSGVRGDRAEGRRDRAWPHWDPCADDRTRRAAGASEGAVRDRESGAGPRRVGTWRTRHRQEPPPSRVPCVRRG